MLKIFTIILITTISSLFAQSAFHTYKTPVKKVTSEYLYIENSPNFEVGSSGVVLHSFDDEHKTIIALVEVVKKDADKAILRYKNYEGLKQSALPSYKIKPKVGDTVILNFLYQRAMAITPNEQTQHLVTTKYDTIEWIHPDNFASKLFIDYTPVPKKEDFRKECSDNSFALLFFVIEDRGYFVDCNSFKTLKEVDIQNDSNQSTMKPFYSRLKEIKGRMFGLMGGDGIKDYNRYYKELLGIK